MSNVIDLHDYDPKCAAIMDAIVEVIQQRCEGMSLPLIIGILEMTKAAYLKANFYNQ